jgi:hypothetical protein
MAEAFAGEFGRVKRSGDRMKGDLDFGANQIVSRATPGGVLQSTLRTDGFDMKFYDLTVGVEVTLFDLLNGGGGGTVPKLREEQVVAPGQTSFTLATGSILVGSRSLLVFYNGVIQDEADITETSPTQIDVAFDTSMGGRILFLVPRGVAASGSPGTVLVTALDSTSDVLNLKIVPGPSGNVATSVIGLGGTNQTLQIETTDEKVGAFPGDAAPGDLNAKITVAGGLGKSVVGATLQLTNANGGAAPYTPGVPAQWSGPAPTTIQAALDRIAALLYTHRSNTPIP